MLCVSESVLDHSPAVLPCLRPELLLSSPGLCSPALSPAGAWGWSFLSWCPPGVGPAPGLVKGACRGERGQGDPESHPALPAAPPSARLTARAEGWAMADLCWVLLSAMKGVEPPSQSFQSPAFQPGSPTELSCRAPGLQGQPRAHPPLIPAHPVLSSLPGHFQAGQGTQPCASTRGTSHGRFEHWERGTWPRAAPTAPVLCPLSPTGPAALVPVTPVPTGPCKSRDIHRGTPPPMHVICSSCPGLMPSIGLGVNPLFGLHKFPKFSPFCKPESWWGGDRTDTSVGTAGVTNSWHLWIKYSKRSPQTLRGHCLGRPRARAEHSSKTQFCGLGSLLWQTANFIKIPSSSLIINKAKTCNFKIKQCLPKHFVFTYFCRENSKDLLKQNSAGFQRFLFGFGFFNILKLTSIFTD